jgi:hypothetical protein
MNPLVQLPWNGDQSGSGLGAKMLKLDPKARETSKGNGETQHSEQFETKRILEPQFGSYLIVDANEIGS